jgi:hypothetical protein
MRESAQRHRSPQHAPQLTWQVTSAQPVDAPRPVRGASSSPVRRTTSAGRRVVTISAPAFPPSPRAAAAASPQHHREMRDHDQLLRDLRMPLRPRHTLSADDSSVLATGAVGRAAPSWAVARPRPVSPLVGARR